MTIRRVYAALGAVFLAVAAFWLGLILHLLRAGGPAPASSALLAEFVAAAASADPGAAAAGSDALLLRSPRGASLLVDCGGSDDDARALLTQVRRAQSEPPQAIVLTSARAASVGGLPYLLAHSAFRGRVYLPCSPARFVQTGGAAARAVLSAASAQHVEVASWQEYDPAASHPGDSEMKVTLIPIDAPAAPSDGGAPPPGEAAALAVRVDYGGSEGATSVVYAAALTPAQDDALIDERAHLDCDVLAVGVRADQSGGVSSELLALAGPRVIVTYGIPLLPTPPALAQRLAASDAAVERTDATGTVTLGLEDRPWQPIAVYGALAALPAAR